MPHRGREESPFAGALRGTGYVLALGSAVLLAALLVIAAVWWVMR